jgi:predicted cation transporter
MTWRDNPDPAVATGLFIIFFIVLLGPFLVKKIEHQLEAFLFACGVAAVTVCTFLLKGVEAGGEGHSLEPVWSWTLLEAGLLDPIMITAAVLGAGFVFHYGRNQFKDLIEKALVRIDLKIFIFIIIFSLGMVASLITAIISALLLVEVITVLKLDRKTETDLTVLTCFSIGLGAALTPVGEPLSTIVIVTKLEESFFFLLFEIGHFVIPSIVAISAFGVYYVSRSHVDRDTLSEDKEEEELKEVPIRAFKVYIFVMALVFLGTGFAPIIEWYIIKLPAGVLYWVNMSSAILDNATLASAEIVKTMSTQQLHAALMALLISGGMLIPGNIPNIICANKLHITSKEWARFGVPFGMVWMAIFFVILFILKL